VEIFLIPGFGVFGVAGILLLFGGMIGVFVGGPANLFPGAVRGRNDLAYALTTVLISTLTSGILMYFVGKHLGGLPVVNRLVLKHRSGDTVGEDEGLLAAMAAPDGPVRIGQVGRTLTPLRPAGRVQIDDRIIDVVSEMGFIDTDVAVRVVSVDQFRTVVEKA
jgi:membrane-bound serine protease (ClpP class)